MTHPDEYRVFYWAPDMSFCGFAANHIFKKSQKSTSKGRAPKEEPQKMPSLFKDVKKNSIHN